MRFLHCFIGWDGIEVLLPLRTHMHDLHVRQQDKTKADHLKEICVCAKLRYSKRPIRPSAMNLHVELGLCQTDPELLVRITARLNAVGGLLETSLSANDLYNCVCIYW